MNDESWIFVDHFFYCIDFLLCLKKFRPYMFDPLVSIPGSATDYICFKCKEKGDKGFMEETYAQHQKMKIIKLLKQ
jgi:hypothetical protein